MCKCKDPIKMMSSISDKYNAAISSMTMIPNTTVDLLPEPLLDAITMASVSVKANREVEIRLDPNLAACMFKKMTQGYFDDTCKTEITEVGCSWWTGPESNLNARVRVRSTGERTVKLTRSATKIAPGYVYQARIASNAILSAIQEHQPSVKINPPPGVFVTKGRDTRTTFPQVIFTEPNIAAVGHTLASAQSAGLKVRAVDSDFNIPGAWFYGDGQPGWARWVIEEGTEKLVCATFVCVEGSEFANASQVAILQGMTLKEMVHVVPPFPTRGEIWTYLLNAAGY